MLKWLQFIGSTGYLKVKSRDMQVVVSLDSTKVTRVVGIPFQICSLCLSAKAYTKYVLLE